jgi:hypothetical protein
MTNKMEHYTSELPTQPPSATALGVIRPDLSQSEGNLPSVDDRHKYKDPT